MKPNPNTAIPIHITPHHLTLSPALSQFVSAKVARLPRFAGDALAADVVLRRHHGTAHGKLFSASARLSLPGRDLHATATHADLYSAVTGLTKKLARQSRKRETRLLSAARKRPRATRRDRPGRKHAALPRWEDSSATQATAPPLIKPASAETAGLVERSSSLNPALGLISRHLQQLSAASRARAAAARSQTTPPASLHLIATQALP